jgi:hypothetical protein
MTCILERIVGSFRAAGSRPEIVTGNVSGVALKIDPVQTLSEDRARLQHGD